MAVTKGHGNPKWTREETILALELYLECREKMPGPSDPRVVALSNELSRLPIHAREARRESFRNPEGVAFKLQNLRNVATGRGLGNVSAMDIKVWEDFGHRPDFVALTAECIREEARVATGQYSLESEDAGSFEGRVFVSVHKRRERDRSLRGKLLKTRLLATGALRCDACGDGPKTRDETLLDAGFEAHHTMPLAQIAGEQTTTKVEDLALLCATCHRLLHRAMLKKNTWMSIADLQIILASDA